MIAVGVFIVGLAQLITDDQPDTFTALTPDWFDDIFDSFTALSGLLILVGLYFINENRYHATRLALAMHVERVGLSFLMTIVAMSVTAATMYHHALPMTLGTMGQIVFWLWGWTRLHEIRRALKGLTR